MSSTTSSMNHSETTRSARPVLWRAGLVAGIGAAAATTAIAATARAAGISLAVDGEQIPLAGFAQFTLVGAVLGVALAKVLSRTMRRPRRAFVAITAGLTVLSLVPDVLVDTTSGSKLVLMLTHVVAAVIIIPVLTGRIETDR